jgi:YHS domain-containing protein
MLSNRYLGERADIPIDVAGKTYHGCCANCAARLAAHEDMRTATDPVNGHPVDKATAVLARDASNRVHYFESELTLAQYSGHP